MSILLNATLAVLVVLAGMSLFVQSMQEEWEGREYFARFKGQWWEGILTASLISLGVFYLLVSQLGEAFQPPAEGTIHAMSIFGSEPLSKILFLSIPLVIVVYVLAFSAWTDLFSGHAPSEMAWLGIWLTMPFMLGYLLSGDRPQIYISLLIIGFVAFFLYFNRGLGDADVRLLWLINIGTVWWVGLYWTVMLFAIASFLQIIVHLIAQKAGWGRLVNMKYSKLEKSFRRIFAKFNKKIDPNKESRDRRHVPFIPVMALTWIVGLPVLLIWFPEVLPVTNYVLMF